MENNERKNIMLISLSFNFQLTQNFEVNEIEYQTENELIKGIQTNEACTKYMIKKLKNNNESLDKIIVILTKETVNPYGKYDLSYGNNDNNKKVIDEIKTKTVLKKFYGEDDFYMYDYFRYRINDYCKKEGLDPPNYEEIYIYDYKKFCDKKNSDIISELIYKLKKINNTNKISMNIDTSGGYRDFSNLLVLVAKILQYMDVKIDNVLYASKDLGKDTGEIHNVIGIYKLYDMLNGINEFISYGKVSTINKCFIDSESSEINNLIKSMKEFSNSISLCNVSEIDEKYNELSNSIKSFENKPKNNIDDESEILLQALLPKIKEKFYMEANAKNLQGKSILNVIKWCIDNMLIQQALTIYLEKMPKCLCDLGIIKFIRNQKYDSKCYNNKLFVNDIVNIGFRNIKNSNVVGFRCSNNCFEGKIVYKNGNITFNINDENSMDKIKNIYRIRKYNKLINYTSGDNIFDYKKNEIDDNQRILLFYIVQGYDVIVSEKKSDFSTDRYINCIKFYSLKDLCKFDIPETERTQAKLDEIKRIMTGYVYVRCLRNLINHANGNKSFSNVQMNFFKKYNLKLSLNDSDIAQSMMNSINYIEELNRRRK